MSRDPRRVLIVGDRRRRGVAEGVEGVMLIEGLIEDVGDVETDDDGVDETEEGGEIEGERR